MLYSMWSAVEVADWLGRAHNYSVSHDSVSRHSREHIPDPRMALVDRVRSYGPSSTDRRFFEHILEVMRLSIFQFAEDVLDRQVEVKPKDFLAIAETYREWRDEMRSTENTEGPMMRALMETITETMTPAEAETFKETLRTKIERAQSREEG